MTTDTVADMLTRIRNANLAKHQIVQIPSTNMTRSIAKVLLDEELITSVEELKHYAEDAGETQEVIDAITEPEISLAFEAKGVIIK